MKSNSFAHSMGDGHGNSGYNGPVQVRHGEDCCCSWCLQGVK